MTTRDFCRAEFACKCECGFADPHPYLVVGLQRLRNILRVPVLITNACRCPVHNKLVGGADNSFHLPKPDFDGYGCAADVRLPDIPLGQVYQVVTSMEAFGNGGIGIYVDDVPRIHLDIRGIMGTYAMKQWAFIDGVSTTVTNAIRTDNLRRGVV